VQALAKNGQVLGQGGVGLLAGYDAPFSVAIQGCLEVGIGEGGQDFAVEGIGHGIPIACSV
jgi:hypothetical protein